jgi:hypothetical protein
MKCLFCNLGPADGVSVFRINAKGQPGVWACASDLPKADTRVDPATRAVVEHIEQGFPVPQPEKP